MAFDLISTIVGFLLGTATGAAGTYFANKYTDQRREGEAYSQAKKDFLATKDKLPEFIAELKQDLSKSPEIREFFVIQEGTCLGGSTIPRFLYKHNNANCLLNKIQILENMGYIQDVSPGNAKMYRMTEGFVELVKRYGQKRTEDSAKNTVNGRNDWRM